MKKKHAGNYDEIRCVVCGTPWTEHNETDICARYRPHGSPAWVADAIARHELATTASNLPPTADQAEIARRELIGGVPTREWPEAAKATVPEPSAGPMVHALLRAVGLRNGHAVGIKGEAGP